jgi:hypothetical protein
MIKIIKYKESLLLNVNIRGITPFDFFLIGITVHNKYNLEKQTEIINLINKKTFVRLSKNKTIKEYENSGINIPAGSTFTDILNKETNVDHQTHIKKICNCISEKFLM